MEKGLQYEEANNILLALMNITKEIDLIINPPPYRTNRSDLLS